MLMNGILVLAALGALGACFGLGSFSSLAFLWQLPLLFVILCTISQENSLFQVLIALLVHGEINQLRRLHMKLRSCKKCDVQTITLLFQLRAGSMPRALF